METDITKMTDHDLLITMHEQLKQVRAEMKELKDNTLKRIDDLEKEKLNIAQSDTYLKDAEKIHKDHETRLRSLENLSQSFKGKYAILAVIGMALVSLAISWIVKVL